MTQEGSERREHERKPAVMQIKYRSLDSFFSDYTSNISYGGVFIKTRRPMEIGRAVEMEMEVEGLDKSLKVSGSVVRVAAADNDEGRMPGMGIEFEPLSQEDIKLLDELYEASARKEVENWPDQ